MSNMFSSLPLLLLYSRSFSHLQLNRAFLQDATIHGSEEDVSDYELVERGNSSGVNKNQESGKIEPKKYQIVVIDFFQINAIFF